MKTLTQPVSNRFWILNSTLAFVIAGMLVTTLHELAHVSMARLLGEQVTLYPNVVMTPDGVPSVNAILVAAAGPLFSLIVGLLIIWFGTRYGSGISRLLIIWFGFLSAETGFGYFLIAPFIPGGDTGVVMHLLHAASWQYALLFVLGGIGTYFYLPRQLSRVLGVFSSDKQRYFRLGMYPWLIGTAVLLVIYTGVLETMSLRHIESPSFVILLGVLAIGIFTPMATYRKSAVSEKLNLSFPTSGIVLAGILAFGLIFGLAFGLKIG
jgi:hypothetical protein